MIKGEMIRGYWTRLKDPPALNGRGRISRRARGSAWGTVEWLIKQGKHKSVCRHKKIQGENPVRAFDLGGNRGKIR